MRGNGRLPRWLRLSLALAAAAAAGLAAASAGAQSITLDMGGDGATQGGELTGRIVQLLGLLTVLTLAPSILVMMTSFTRIAVVLSFLRSALATQTTPPNSVLISLALFLTAFVMAPTLEQSYTNGIQPLINDEISEEEAFTRSIEPFRNFMLANVRSKDLQLFLDLSNTDTSQLESAREAPLQALIPAFMISELRRAFEIGFLLFVPFLIIDMTVASILMSMGMMMLPPIIVSLPFKLVFFVLVDGWYLVTDSLVRSFNQVAGAG